MPLNPLDTEAWTVYLLVLARCSGMVVLFPYFSGRSIPAMLRVFLSVMLAVLVFLSLGDTWTLEAHSPLEAIVMLLKELLTGLTIGFIMIMFFTIFVMSGELVSQQAGLMFARVFDPSLDQQVDVLGQFISTLAMVFYLTINGHHLLIKAMTDSFQAIPLGTGLFVPVLTGGLLRISAEMIEVAFKIVAPILFILLMVDFALGLVSKTVPQIHIFILAMPSKILLSLLLLAALLPLLPGVLETILNDFLVRLYQFMQGWV